MELQDLILEVEKKGSVRNTIDLDLNTLSDISFNLKKLNPSIENREFYVFSAPKTYSQIQKHINTVNSYYSGVSGKFSRKEYNPNAFLVDSIIYMDGITFFIVEKPSLDKTLFVSAVNNSFEPEKSLVLRNEI